MEEQKSGKLEERIVIVWLQCQFLTDFDDY